MKDEFRVASIAEVPVEEKIPFSLIRATFLITIPSFVHGRSSNQFNLTLIYMID